MKKHHKERALHFEGASDGMRLMETFKESVPHWELVDIIGELEQARTTLGGVAKGTHVIVPRGPTPALFQTVIVGCEPVYELFTNVADAKDQVTLCVKCGHPPELHRAMLSAAPRKVV